MISKNLLGVSAIIAFLLVMQFSTALTINRVEVDQLSPGETSTLTVWVENEQSTEIEEVALSIDLTNLPLTAVGSSQDTIDHIDDDDMDKFMFTLRAANNAKPGDYSIPYTLTYQDIPAPLKGTFGLTIKGKTDIIFSTNVENPVVGEKGKITLKLINKGNGDARFANLQIIPDGFTLLSEDKIYIGTISADDFETATFDVIFTSPKAQLTGIFEYSNFDNKKLSQDLQIPLVIYTKEQAIQKGIISKNNTGLYIILIVIIVVLWIIWRAISRRRRMKKSREQQSK